jgi:hypothetical protein
VFLILIDSHVSYIPLTLYSIDKKNWGMIDAVRGSEKDAMELS